MRTAGCTLRAKDHESVVGGRNSRAQLITSARGFGTAYLATTAWTCLDFRLGKHSSDQAVQIENASPAVEQGLQHGHRLHRCERLRIERGIDVRHRGVALQRAVCVG